MLPWAKCGVNIASSNLGKGQRESVTAFTTGRGSTLLTRHSSHLERRLPFFGTVRGLDVDKYVLEEIKVMDSGESFLCALGFGEVAFGVRRGDDR